MSDENVKIYPFITTPIGKHKLSQATSGGVPVNLTHIAVGDGGGSEYDPTKEQSELKNETWRGEIDRKTIHPKDPNIVIVIGIVPDDAGGFFIRELELIDEDGDPIYISAYPTSYKPVPGSNISKDMLLEQWLIVEDTDAITLTADLNVCRATVGDLNYMAEQFTPEIGTVALQNTQTYPFNNSATTISLKTVRDNLDYTIQTEVVISSGSVGAVEVFDKQTNGFKLRFTGSGKTAGIKYYVTGGLIR